MYKSSLTFTEPPATQEEIEIASTFQLYFQAFRKKNKAGILAFISPTAKIESFLFKRLATKEEFEKFLNENLPRLISTRIENILIRAKDKTHASVYADILLEYAHARVGPSRIIWSLEKDVSWLITESRILS